MKRILLVRHGQTEWNADRRLQGQTDIPLNDRGRDQARALAGMIRGMKPDVVATSDLMRARETAALLGFPDARCEPLLREQRLGVWEGRTIASVQQETPQHYIDWRAGSFAPEGGDLWADFRARVQTALHIVLEQADKTALLVCHGGVIRALLDAALDLSPSRIIPVGPASVTILAYPQGHARLEAFNVAAAPDLDAPD
ncbi:histidine phosphatase family protein [Falsirhodobacter sp. 20TX0035]|uniref:histidine phosphatase family protein n=1 Tax=Falsirhodobacter sp. 20TX0035 TaxID=3022019 RepID=UPI00232C3BDD|nr:histidine phosphatase family protein [Falsirhodobacter sp. 20TX0035]MDB6454130.1 histidine phosphatase family protein [Falsirhodobacter sp. 20TX0035]